MIKKQSQNIWYKKEFYYLIILTLSINKIKIMKQILNKYINNRMETKLNIYTVKK